MLLVYSGTMDAKSFCVIAYIIVLVVMHYAGSNILQDTFDSPCGPYTMMDEGPVEEFDADSVLSCAVNCFARSGKGSELCFGFNYCQTGPKCILLIRSFVDFQKSDCSNVNSNTDCRHYRMTNAWNTSDESVKPLEIPDTCIDLGFEKHIETGYGNTSYRNQAGFFSVINSALSGQAISVLIENYKAGQDMLVHGQKAVENDNMTDLCVQSIFNMDWEHGAEVAIQTALVLCTNGDVIIQEMEQAATGITIKRNATEKKYMKWFANGHFLDFVYPYPLGSYEDLISAITSGCEIIVAYDLTNYVKLSALSWDSFQVVGQMPWTIKMSQNGGVLSLSPFWYSYLFTSTKTDSSEFDVTKWWTAPSMNTTNLQLVGHQVWLADFCWSYVYGVNRTGEVIKGNVNDLIYHISLGRKVRITTTSDAEEPVSLLVGSNQVWAVMNKMMATDSGNYGNPLSRSVRLLSSTGDMLVYKIEIESTVQSQNTLQRTMKWHVDATDWKEIFSTEEYQKNEYNTSEAFSGVFEKGATVRVQIPYRGMKLFLTVDNIMGFDTGSIPVATAMHHVQLTDIGGVVTFSATLTKEFFKIYANGTISVMRVNYALHSFVDSETVDNAQIKWYANIKQW